MIALLLAAQLSAAGAAPDLPRPVLVNPFVDSRARVYDGSAVSSRICPPSGALQTSADPALLLRPQDRWAARPQKLGKLPKANYEIAVARSIGGCAAPLVIQYNVGP